MAKMDIAIDLGTSFTSIFVSGNGIVLHEPSVIAYYDNGGRRNLRAVGSEAYFMLGKSPEKTKVVCPIVDGVIKDRDACAVMLGEFVKKILPESYLFKPSIRAVLGVPTGLSVDERKMYEDVLMRSGVDDVTMINNIMLSAIGIELPVTSAFGGIVASIGGGGTEIGVIGLSGIVTGCSINVGGDMIDRALMDRICGKNKLSLGKASVRNLKERIASLIRNDCAAVTVSGIDMDTKNIRTQTLSADELYGTVYDYYASIIEAVAKVINSCSPAVAAEIYKNGINVVGGGAKIPGLANIMSAGLGIRVNVSLSPEFAAVSGGGKLLSDGVLLDEIERHQ